MFNKIKDLTVRLKLDIAFTKELDKYFRLLRRHNGSKDTMSDPAKLRALILRETHVLEKGMTMPEPHFPFGIGRAKYLIDCLYKYAETDEYDRDTVCASVSTIKCYLEYNSAHGAKLSVIEQLLSQFIKNHPECNTEIPLGGNVIVAKSDILQNAKGDFEHLLKSRHSHRNFTDEYISDDLINKALQLASATPSACNRQAWRTHVFKGDKASDILEWQGGCRGFFHKIRTIILVTSDLNSFFAHEPMQAYVDGGMYAMNLVNSLHFLGAGTIPLSCGFPLSKLEELRKFGIPENEIPVLIIGVGTIPESTTVALSNRFEVTKTNTFHE